MAPERMVVVAAQNVHCRKKIDQKEELVPRMQIETGIVDEQ